MARSPNDAMPRTAATLRAPVRLAPAGFVERAVLIVPVKPVSTRPRLSAASTRRAGVRMLPAVPVKGCWRIRRTWGPPLPPPLPPMASPRDLLSPSYGQAVDPRAAEATRAIRKRDNVIAGTSLQKTPYAARARRPRTHGAPFHIPSAAVRA